MPVTQLELLEKLGFELTNKRKFVLVVDNKGEESHLKLKVLLIRIVFDVFCYYQDKNESFIEF